MIKDICIRKYNTMKIHMIESDIIRENLQYNMELFDKDEEHTRELENRMEKAEEQSKKLALDFAQCQCN